MIDNCLELFRISSDNGEYCNQAFSEDAILRTVDGIDLSK